MRYLIVNGDDFGMSRGVNRGIMEAHLLGVLTSTSLMVNRPSCAEAAGLARETPSLSVGLHLELEDRAPDPAEAVRVQFEKFGQAMDRPPTHVDGHHDCHLRAEWLPHVMAAAKGAGILVRGHSGVARLGRFYGQWGGETHLEQISVEGLLEILRTDLAEGVTELICHPGYRDPALESSYFAEREAELRTLCDPRVRDALDEMRVQLVGFGDVSRLAVTPPPAPGAGA